MIGILELLQSRGLDMKARVKFVRHQDRRYDIGALVKNGQLEIYQSFQSRAIFDCDYIVVFLGLQASKAKFYSVYKVADVRIASPSDLPSNFIYPEMLGENDFHYTLNELNGFDDLRNRVVIDWGRSALSWHQWMKDKEIVEILPKGYVKEFPGYLDFTLAYEELKEIIANPDANREWHVMLSSVAGVYLIVDHRNGAQYVGSAYGEKGILGRWSIYVKNGHGDNLKLKELVQNNQDCVRHFHFTILRTLPKTLTNKEVIKFEMIYKEKLGTRAFGLNLN